MIITIVNLAVTAVITAVIGYQWKHHVFPFRRWDARPVGVNGWINLILIAYNGYMIIMTWISLGLFTIPAIIYAVSILIFMAIGWFADLVKLFIDSARQFGIGYAWVDFTDRVKRSVRRRR
jgi:energy-converting hydrogenase Eha subunit E